MKTDAELDSIIDDSLRAYHHAGPSEPFRDAITNRERAIACAAYAAGRAEAIAECAKVCESCHCESWVVAAVRSLESPK